MAEPTSAETPRRFDRARFYTIKGRQYPSVTTVLDIIAKPALGPWYAKEERRYFEAAMLEILSRPGARDPEYVLGAVADALTGVKAADRAKQQAATIGTAIHAGIEWTLRTELGEDAGVEPRLPDAAAWAVESWKDWAKSVALEPLAIEHTVYCEICGYAGTLDLYARVQGVLTVLDWKSGKAIYPEAFLQNAAYRHAAQRLGMPADQGLIVRLPKLIGDPAWEGRLARPPRHHPVGCWALPLCRHPRSRQVGDPRVGGGVPLERALSPPGAGRALGHDRSPPAYAAATPRPAPVTAAGSSPDSTSSRPVS
jgi:hypothetical protein